MYTNNMKSNDLKTVKPQEEFLRQVIFMKDDNKVLAVFPFYHEITSSEYDMLISSFYDDDEDEIPEKHEFCLMNEENFGWGWIHNKMINHLHVANESEYYNFKQDLVASKIIKEIFVLNEE